MIIARDKKQKNIAEYVIYMWQVEDLIRACNFDIEIIQKSVIDKFNQPEEVMSDIRQWYTHLIKMMQDEKIQKSGHLQFMKNTVNDIYNTHLYLLNKESDSEYIRLYNDAQQQMQMLVQKNKGESANEVELLFVALYGFLMLRLKGESVSENTQSDIRKISSLVSYLSEKHMRFESGKESMDSL
ncbi:MAG: DUF4924 family protein [Bacteroidales bacterium]|jgi:hypothetical protein|nr:DUF4924 family protein [Bacteroidales bacterium]